MAPMKRPATGGNPPTLSIRQVAVRLHINQKAVRRLLGDQVLQFLQSRGILRVPVAEVVRYERRNQA